MFRFLILDLDERANLLKKKGTFIIKARSDAFFFSLYSVADFYVEVVTSISENRITQIEAFTTGWRLEKYLNEIEIPASLLPY